MNRNAILFCFGVVAILLSPKTGNSQLSTDPKVRVEISTDKKIYLRGEPVKLRVVLVNAGSFPFYLSKSSRSPEVNGEMSAKHVPGFEIQVTQLRGMRKLFPSCAVTLDDLYPPDLRAPEQVFKEDFFPLPPGGLVGLDLDLTGYLPFRCVKPYHAVGKYRVIAAYTTKGEYTQRVTSLPHKETILDGHYESDPVTFTIH